MVDTSPPPQLCEKQVKQHNDWNVVASSYEDMKKEDEGEASCHLTWTPTRRLSSLLDKISCLAMISELTEAEFEPIPGYSEETEEGDDSAIPPPPMLDPSSVETRWSPGSVERRKRLEDSSLLMPERVPSYSKLSLDDDWLAEPPMDAPLEAPRRMKSLDLDSELEDSDMDFD